ncbi:MAG: alkaline phosphatase family protein, partial [Solirubrobacteraceae bacterium]
MRNRRKYFLLRTVASTAVASLTAAGIAVASSIGTGALDAHGPGSGAPTQGGSAQALLVRAGSLLGNVKPGEPPTSTPIKHLVVIFQENVSFDHYFGTYPNAANPPGEPAFHAAPGTPSVNGLSAELLTQNPNLSNPQRLDPSQAHTCDQDHGYSSEQKAFDHGLMDRFVQNTGREKTVAQCTGIASG